MRVRGMVVVVKRMGDDLGIGEARHAQKREKKQAGRELFESV